MGANRRASVVVERFAARQPSPDRGAVLVRGLGQLLAEGKTLQTRALSGRFRSHGGGRQ